MAALTFRQRLTRVTLGVVIVLLLAMWVYAFGFASKDAVAKVGDRDWAERAEQLCERRNELIRTNVQAARDRSTSTPQQIAVAVAATTDLIEATLDQVVAPDALPDGEEDRAKIAEFERVYRVYIADRRAAEAKLAGGEMVELNESTLEGAPVSRTIEDFTNPNRMSSCAVPAAY
jgi:hypothetical protein